VEFLTKLDSMPVFIDLIAFLEDGQERKPFHLSISAPARSKDSGDYSCRIHAPSLFKKEKVIFGISEEQARELAIAFLLRYLGPTRVVDQGGHPIDLRSLA
jgi:hypothetical protein